MGLQPRTARVVKDGREEDILIAELQVGDKVSVRPGEQIPVDGVIVEDLTRKSEKWLRSGKEGKKK